MTKEEKAVIAAAEYCVHVMAMNTESVAWNLLVKAVLALKAAREDSKAWVKSLGCGSCDDTIDRQAKEIGDLYDALEAAKRETVKQKRDAFAAGTIWWEKVRVGEEDNTGRDAEAARRYPMPDASKLKAIANWETARLATGCSCHQSVANCPIHGKAEIASTYPVGSTGPGGGLVFAPGLEAAPKDLRGEHSWQEAMDTVASLSGGWRLPTKDELNLMYVNLHKQGLGGFASAWYWSSSQYNYGSAWFQGFSDGNQDGYYKYGVYRVRAVRALATVESTTRIKPGDTVRVYGSDPFEMINRIEDIEDDVAEHEKKLAVDMQIYNGLEARIKELERKEKAHWARMNDMDRHSPNGLYDKNAVDGVRE